MRRLAKSYELIELRKYEKKMRNLYKRKEEKYINVEGQI